MEVMHDARSCVLYFWRCETSPCARGYSIWTVCGVAQWRCTALHACIQGVERAWLSVADQIIAHKSCCCCRIKRVLEQDALRKECRIRGEKTSRENEGRKRGEEGKN